jgi:N-acetylglutamate synthase-like GNAT family acetyltransferase
VGPAIRACTREDIGVLVEIIRESFRDVAERFGLTPENAPRHPSNCTAEWIQRDMDKGVTFFVMEKESRASGCAALERAHPGECYLKRLAVLPDRRRQGLGGTLVAHVFAEAKRLGARRVGIAIIAEQAELKNWYRKIGFTERDTREYSHLPFRVTFMSHEIN